MCDHPRCHLAEDECTATPTAQQAFQESVETEMAYTTWEESCKEPGLIMNQETGLLEEIRACRRFQNHSLPFHASGYGAGFRTW